VAANITITADTSAAQAEIKRLTDKLDAVEGAAKKADSGLTGLSDTVKAVAEEMDIKPNILKKAIKLAHKAEFGREQQDHALLETILTTVGKTL
jgi:hypothetical protein